MSATVNRGTTESSFDGIEVEPEVDAEATQDEASPVTAIGNGHTPVSFTMPTAGSPSQNEGGEAGDGESAAGGSEFSINFGPFGFSTESSEETEESSFEAVEGFEESSETEADEAAEATVDAWYAEASETEQQEFFQFLAPLIIPAVKSLIPVIAGAAAKNLPAALSLLMQRLGNAGKQVKQRKRETGDESGIEAAELEAAIQQLETIVDRDDRVQVMDTTKVPWRRICHLKIRTQDGKSFLGTGALVGPRTLITAGHCVYMHSHGGWPTSIAVSPGRNGSQTQFGTVNAVGLRSVRGWVQSKSRDYDYGAIILPRSFATKDPSGFGFAALPDQMLRDKKLNTAGYPGDKEAGTMWYAGRRARSVTPTTLVYNTATMGGQSGSPVWIKNANNQRIMVGIHTNGAANGNSATRITAAVAANMKRWKEEGGLPSSVLSTTIGRRAPSFRSQMEPA